MLRSSRTCRMIRNLTAMVLAALLFMGPVASAQTPESDDPEVVPTQVIEPTVEPTPTTAPEPTIAPTPTDEPQPTTGPASPTAVPPTEVPPTVAPTPTSAPVEVPDELETVGDTVVSVAPGHYVDLKMNYTLGSDRDSTDIEASLIDPSGESLAGWTIEPVDRDEVPPVDPSIADGPTTAEIAVTDLVQQGDVVELVWRLTAPAHVETAQTVRVDVESHSDGQLALDEKSVYRVSASASAHNPTLECIAGEDNTWNCTVETTHPGVINATVSANVPAGWTLEMNGAPLTTEPTPVSVDGTGSFAISAKYPVGCPDPGVVSSTTVSFSLAYPSGDVHTLTNELTLAFERPTSTLSVTAFSFDEITNPDALSTTGHLTLAVGDAPCAWQATLDFTDFISGSSVISDATFTVSGVDGLDGASVTSQGNSIVIIAPDSSSDLDSTEFTVYLTVTFSHPIPPGVYSITVITQLVWLDAL